jgi:glycosyltransferase involved in cell wall biosynthesis
LTLSEADRDRLRAVTGSEHIIAITNGVDIDYFRPLPEPQDCHTLIFAGSMSYFPNVDGATLFAKEILPLISERIPQTRFLIVGHNPADEVRTLARDERIVVTGTVPDVRPYFARSNVCVVPLRAGGGIKNKVLEAMAMGRPVVTTPIGVQGLNVTHGKDIFIAQTPGEFARWVVGLLRNDELRAHTVSEARRLIEEVYSWPQAITALEKQYLKLTSGTPV